MSIWRNHWKDFAHTRVHFKKVVQLVSYAVTDTDEAIKDIKRSWAICDLRLSDQERLAAARVEESDSRRIWDLNMPIKRFLLFVSNGNQHLSIR